MEGPGTEDEASGHESTWRHAQWALDDMMTITGHVALTLQRWEGCQHPTPAPNSRLRLLPLIHQAENDRCSMAQGSPRASALLDQRPFQKLPSTTHAGAPRPPPCYTLWPQVAAQVDCVLGSAWGSRTSHLAGHRTQVRPLRSPRAAVFSRLELWLLPRHTEAWQTHAQTTDRTELAGVP